MSRVLEGQGQEAGPVPSGETRMSWDLALSSCATAATVLSGTGSSVVRPRCLRMREKVQRSGRDTSGTGQRQQRGKSPHSSNRQQVLEIACQGAEEREGHVWNRAEAGEGQKPETTSKQTLNLEA